MEFEIKTDLEKSLPATIDFNFEEIKTDLTGKLGYYNSLVVTEDSIKGAKADKSLLNNLKEAIENKRKEVKKQCLKPYEDFEKKCKELVSLIDEPVKAIDTQIKAFDEIKQNEKYAEITAYYNENIGELLEIVPLDKIVNAKWKNVTMPLDTIRNELGDKIFKIRNDLKIIVAFGSEFELNIKDKYLQSYDMSAALAEKNRLEEQKIKLAAAEKARKETEEAQKTAIAETPPKTAPICNANITPIIPQETQQTVVNEPVRVCEDRKTIKVIFYDTTAEFRADMKALTDKHNIKYGGIQ